MKTWNLFRLGPFVLGIVHSATMCSCQRSSELPKSHKFETSVGPSSSSDFGWFVLGIATVGPFFDSDKWPRAHSFVLRWSKLRLTWVAHLKQKYFQTNVVAPKMWAWSLLWVQANGAQTHHKQLRTKTSEVKNSESELPEMHMWDPLGFEK